MKTKLIIGLFFSPFIPPLVILLPQNLNSNSFNIKNVMKYEKLTLCSLSPIKQTDLSVGTHLLNSLIQLCNVDLGTKTI